MLISVFLRPSAEGVIPGLIFPGIAGLLIWRRFRHRRLRLARRFVAKVRKMPEVRLVALDGMRFTVVADRAQAKTYVRANALLDSVNSSMFFGDPFTLVIREGRPARGGEGPALRPGRPLRARGRGPGRPPFPATTPR